MDHRRASQVICTICSKNYLHFARTLMNSVERTHPDWDRVVLLVDRVEGAFDPARENFRVIEVSELDIPLVEAFCFRYTILELNTAAKPWLFERLLERDGYQRAIYLDPDILVHRRMVDVEAALDTGAFCVLTPHLTGPIDDGRKPSEVEVLRAGAYNLGFLALQRHPELDKFLPWWQARLERRCVVDLDHGLFVDQKWMDLVPGMREGVHILRHEGYNVAYWNLMHRKVELGPEGPTVNGVPLVFFHFSGLDPRAPAAFSKHQDRYRLGTLGPVRALVESYCETVLSNGLAECVRWPYAFARLADGVLIPDVLRYYLRLHPELEKMAPGVNPFALNADFFNQPFEQTLAGDPLVSRFMHAVWEDSHDLRAVFPDPGGEHRMELAVWFAENRLLNFKVDPIWVSPIEESLRKFRGKPKPTRASLDPALVRMRRVGKRFIPKAAKDWLRTLLQPPLGGGDRVQRFVRDMLRTLPGFVKNRLRSLILPLGTTLPRPRPIPSVRRFGFHEYDDDFAALPISEPAIPARPGINVVGYLRSELGVGESARMVVLAADAGGLPVSLVDFTEGCSSTSGDERFVHRFGSSNPHPVNVICVNADQLPLAFSTLGPAFFENRINVGFWMWELPEFPHDWLGSFGLVDEVWVPSRFCQEAVGEKSPVPVYRMPIPVRVDLERRPSRAELGLPEDRFLFLTMWDMHSFQERKNPEAVLEAYRRAFPGRRDVGLVVKTMNTATSPEEWLRLEERFRKTEGIFVIDTVISRQDVWGLEAACDCFVSLHRSEGFGIGLAECMALGKPVIATGWSGNVDFTREDNSCLVRYELVNLERDHGPYRRGQVWADPDPEHAAQHMRRLVDDASFRERIAEAGRRTMREEFSPEAVGRRYVRRLDALRHWRT